MTELVCETCATPLPGGSNYCNECGTPVPGQAAGPRQKFGFPTDLRQALLMATAGEYEIHHELGRGGMGSVFLAREIGLDRLVAIKVLPPSLMFDEGLIVRFKREARMVAKLHHPNIIPVYRVHHSHNLAFYTMHFVSGRSLSEIMSSSRSLTLREIERAMLDAAAGLGYAHKRGVVHRDVKPANILVDAEGQVHLTDFGIAKALVGSTQLTETGAVIGTPQYMAPEQCDGRAVDGRADQYSLAVVGYQLLAGHPPFEADSMKELIYHHLFTPPKPLGEIRPDTPGPLRDVIHKALSKDPADRFASMEDFRMAIEGKGPPVFVKWIDGPDERRLFRRKGKRGRRATDMPTTQRLHEIPWALNGDQDAAAGPRLSGYQRAVAALAVAAISISAVGVLALSRGAGVAASWGGNESGVVDLAAIDVQLRPSFTDSGDGSSTPSSESAEQVGTNGAGHAGASGETTGEAKGEDDGDEMGQEGPGRAEILTKRTQPTPAARRLLPVPVELLDELQSKMKQGRVLIRAERYATAEEYFKEVKRRANAALSGYRADGILQQLIRDAEDEVRKVLLICARSNHPSCS
jgi:serine/threonine protein kinase